MRTHPPTCAGDCGRTLRPYGTKAAEQPGTVAQAARGYCFKCYKGLPRIYGDAPQRCTNCDCKFRPRKTSLADYPNTRSHKGKGLCTLCHKRAARGTLVEDAPIDDPEATALRWSRAPEIEAKRAAAHRPTPEEPELTDPTLIRLRAGRENRRNMAEQAARIRAEQEARRHHFIHNRRAA